MFIHKQFKSYKKSNSWQIGYQSWSIDQILVEYINGGNGK
jgi:hypothetical protein